MRKTVLYTLLMLMFALAAAMPALAQEDEEAPEEPDCYAFINGIVGTVEFQAADAEDEEAWDVAELNQCLNVGDRVRTGEDGKAAIKYGEGLQLRANASTVLTISQDPDMEDPGEDPSSIDMEIGELFSEMDNELMGEDATFKVNTPSGVVAVRGTEFNVAVDEEGKAKINVLDGVVAVFNELGEVLAEAGKATELLKDALPLDPFDFDIDAFKEELDAWKDAISIGKILEGVEEMIDEKTDELKEKMDVPKIKSPF